MLKENLIMLRTIHGFSQEEIAGRINISRQAYAIYGVTVDSLLKEERVEGIGSIPPAPAGKSIWGAVTVNDRGQIVIPKDAREQYGISGGSRLIVCGDEVGIALIPVEAFEAGMKKAMEYAYIDANRLP